MVVDQGGRMKQCLNCSAISEDDAERCVDCNVPFHQYRPVSGKPHSAVMQDHSVGWLSPIGWVLVIIGLLMVLYGLFASGAPQYSETLNIGLLNDKTNMVIAGGFSFTSGSILLAVGAILKEVGDARRKGAEDQSLKQ
jgi:hypothetical protein